ncbi:MAG: hypothetical protein NUW00_03860 [Candidatus Kaiserbacteria bacterium]|nr:hypothetical protein [Candidatus Kaiserbacteria bacterium]
MYGTCRANRTQVELEGLEILEFKKRIKEANSAKELLVLCENQRHGEDTRRLSGHRRLVRKVLALATTSEQVIALWNVVGYMGPQTWDNPILDRMIELIQTRKDLDSVYYVFCIEEMELKRRNFIRKIFDTADKLKYPTNS